MRIETHLIVLMALSVIEGKAVSGGGQFTLSGQVQASGGFSSGGSFGIAGQATQMIDMAEADPFTLVTLPLQLETIQIGEVKIQIELAGDQIHISWPSEAVGYVLEFASDLLPTTRWFDAPIAPGQTLVTIPFDQQARFFRLRH